MQVPELLSEQEKQDWLAQLTGVGLCSDAFFPFRDGIDHAARYGVSYISQVRCVEAFSMRQTQLHRHPAVFLTTDIYSVCAVFAGMRTKSRVEAWGTKMLLRQWSRTGFQWLCLAFGYFTTKIGGPGRPVSLKLLIKIAGLVYAHKTHTNQFVPLPQPGINISPSQILSHLSRCRHRGSVTFQERVCEVSASSRGRTGRQAENETQLLYAVAIRGIAKGIQTNQ